MERLSHCVERLSHCVERVSHRAKRLSHRVEPPSQCVGRPSLRTSIHLRSVGIDADINTLETLLAAAETADKEQEKTLAAAPLSTAERNAAAKRIDSAIRHISAKGVLAFALDPDVRAQFDALDDGPALKRPAPAPK
ncbi:MAG: hypothetical protein ABTQ32_19790 [Myxococcaceae bacterium]